MSPSGLRGLRQVHRHEVRLGDELLERHQPHPHLRRPTGLHVGVVGDHAHPEGAQPLRDQHADAAEPDDADGLLVELDAGVLAALPLAVAAAPAGRADVPGGGEHQRDGQLGGGDDVRGRRVDDHDAVLGRGLHVDVVEADPGAGDDGEPPCCRERLGVDLGGRADEERVDVDDGGEELVAVRAVAVTDLEVRPERVQRGGAELFGDQDYGLAHVTFLTGCRSDLDRPSTAVWGGPRVALHDVVPDRGCYPTEVHVPWAETTVRRWAHAASVGPRRPGRHRARGRHGDHLPRARGQPGRRPGVLVRGRARRRRVRCVVRRPQGRPRTPAGAPGRGRGSVRARPAGAAVRRPPTRPRRRDPARHGPAPHPAPLVDP